MASELAIVSTMFNSTHIPDETPMARIRLRAKDGRVSDLELKAGRDTAEWAYDNREGRASRDQTPAGESGGEVSGGRILLE